MIVYMITTGDYSDYNVHSIWSTREKAQEIFNLLTECGNQPNPIDEVIVDSLPGPTPIPGWGVEINATTGEEVRSYRTYYSSSRKSPEVMHSERNFTISKIDNKWVATWKENSYNLPPRPVTIHAIGRTKEQALKSARDFQAQWLATREQVA